MNERINQLERRIAALEAEKKQAVEDAKRVKLMEKIQAMRRQAQEQDGTQDENVTQDEMKNVTTQQEVSNAS